MVRGGQIPQGTPLVIRIFFLNTFLRHSSSNDHSVQVTTFEHIVGKCFCFFLSPKRQDRKSIINFNFSFYSLRTSSPLQRALQWISILLLFYWPTVNKINQVFSLSLRQKIKERGFFFSRLITSTQETGTKTKPENQSFTTAKAVESDQKTFVDGPQTTVTPSNHF